MLGKLFIISGLSAAGKTTLVEHALSSFPNATKVITCTTRTKRPGERDGVDYRFLTQRQFHLRKEFEKFAEFKSNVYGNMYGTLKEDISAACRKYSAIFLIVDIQGAATLGELYTNAYKVFVTAATEELAVRLAERNASPEDVKKRIATAKFEITQMRKQHFDLIIENKNGQLEEVQKHFCIALQNAITDTM